MHELTNASATRIRLAATRAAQRGFTLVEVMVVIVILGVLATIVTRNVMGEAARARVKLCESQVLDLQSAVDLYRLHNQKPPEGWNVLLAPDSTGEAYLKLKVVPTDPWGQELILRRADRNDRVFVLSLGLDGQEGTEDDISSETVRDRKPK